MLFSMMQTQYSRLTARVQDISADNDELRQGIEERDKKIEEAVSWSRKAEKDIEVLEKNVEAANERFGEMERHIKERDEDLASLREEVEEKNKLSEQLEKLRSLNVQFAGKIQELRKENENWKAQGLQPEDKKTLEIQLSVLTSDNTRLAGELQTAQEALEMMRAEQEALSRDLHEDTGSFAGQGDVPESPDFTFNSLDKLLAEADGRNEFEQEDEQCQSSIGQDEAKKGTGSSLDLISKVDDEAGKIAALEEKEEEMKILEEKMKALEQEPEAPEEEATKGPEEEATKAPKEEETKETEAEFEPSDGEIEVPEEETEMSEEEIELPEEEIELPEDIDLPEDIELPEEDIDVTEELRLGYEGPVLFTDVPPAPPIIHTVPSVRIVQPKPKEHSEVFNFLLFAFLAAMMLAVPLSYWSERAKWIAANEETRMAVISLRDYWSWTMVAKVMFTAENLLAVDRAFLG